MAVYQRTGERDKFSHLYEQARAADGVDYLGSVSQTELAAALRGATLMSYPNTFAETGCIAAMEAMASGLHIVTSDLGALSETTLGFADLIPKIAGGPDVRRYGLEFCARVLTALDRRTRDPIGFAERCFDQVQTINRTSTWALRAIEWENQLAAWANQKRAAKVGA